jgi:hypothetical protein
MSPIPWLLFALFCGSLITWSLTTKKAWHWGRLVTRSDSPSGYFQFLLGTSLPMIFALVIAYEAVR